MLPTMCLRNVKTSRLPTIAAILAIILAAQVGAPAALAQKTAPDKCLAFAHNDTPLFQRAAVRFVKLKPYQVGLRYIGHSTFVITSPKGVTLATDYNDYVVPKDVPTAITMNLAHDTHHSLAPNPQIKHVIKGWNAAEPTKPAIIDKTIEDVRIRNIPTNIRTWGSDTIRFGNSIFVFEIAGLCIAHLGHLHHTLTVQHLAQIGQMDVVLVPVDGSYTLDLPGTMEVLKALKSPLIIPMHYFSEFTLGRFMEEAKKQFDVERLQTSEYTISRDQLPPKQKVIVLAPAGS
jgi:L-ascorbate metabolism protein UlaG (beta-lactamase superfamily)